MLIRLQKNLSQSELASVLELVAELGCGAALLGDSGILSVEGPAGPELRSRLEDHYGVSAVIDAGEARELVLRGPRTPDRAVRVRDAVFGAGWIAIAAGPCAVESGERLVEIARGVRRRGATLLRGGAFKPRTSPYSFQGSGQAGLEALARARLETGLGVVTEVLDPRQVEAVGEVADMFQVGSRNMANTPLLSELGRARKPVLLKRGFAATLREFLLAAEFVLAGGNQEVVLCERGIRGFDPSTRNVLDLGGLAALKRMTHLPVIVDPSHAAGRADLVPPLARAALAAGADGLMLEVHTSPVEAHSDAEQAIDLSTFERLVADARALAELDGRRLASAAITPAGAPE
jgi:3-deoxy-7-phosphoheptulonate synthase